MTACDSMWLQRGGVGGGGRGFDWEERGWSGGGVEVGGLGGGWVELIDSR